MMILLVSLRVFLRPGCCMQCILILCLTSGRIDAVKSLWICHRKVRRWEYIFWIFSFPRFQKESVSGTDALLWYRLVCGLTFPNALGSLMHYMASKALLGSHRFLRHFRTWPWRFSRDGEAVCIAKFWINLNFIILQSGTSTTVLSLYRSEAPSSDSSASSVYRSGLLFQASRTIELVVQTIYFSAFM